mgnify:CR=1 FL=1
MIDKRVETVEAALEGLGDGASIMVNGFGGTGVPFALIRALERMTARNLTLILNGVRFVDGFAPGIFDGKRVSKVVAQCSVRYAVGRVLLEKGKGKGRRRAAN